MKTSAKYFGPAVGS